MSDFMFDLAADYEAYGDALVPKILSNGKYNVEVKRAVPGQTSKGKPKIVVTLEVIDGPDAGQQVTDQLTWSSESETAARIFSGALACMGATPEWIKTTRPSLPEVAERLVGARVAITAKEDEWNGQPRNRVNFVKSLGTAPSAGGPAAQAVSLGGTPQQAAPAPQQGQQPQAAPQGQWPSM